MLTRGEGGVVLSCGGGKVVLSRGGGSVVLSHDGGDNGVVLCGGVRSKMGI